MDQASGFFGRATRQLGRNHKITMMFNTCLFLSSQIWDERISVLQLHLMTKYLIIFTELKRKTSFIQVKVFALLGGYAVYVGSHLPKFRESISVPSSRIKHSWPLNMDTRGCPEMSVNNYQHTLCNSSEESRPHLHCGSSLKSLKFHPLSTLPLRDTELNYELWLINFLYSLTCHNFGL
jgi:hypothetical protein